MKLRNTIFTTVTIASLLLIFGCASTPTQSSAGEILDDSVITAKVKTAIFNEKELSAAEIKVVTYKGEVQLSGFVSEASVVPKATAVALTVKGVSSIKNDITVK